MTEPEESENFGVQPEVPPRAMERMHGWRRMRSMRTAIQLLIAVALVSILGSVIPQRNAAPSKVDEFIEDHRFWGEVFDRLGLFEVFTSWWFLTLVGFLLFVTGACLIPRTRVALARARRLKRAPDPGHFPDVRFTTEVGSNLSADEVRAAVNEVLRRRRWRPSPANEKRQWIAERGRSREIGSVLFHWSFFLMAIAAALTITTKFEGSAVVVEKTSWVEGGRVNFDTYSEGAFAQWLNPHAGFTVTVDDFEVTYGDDGIPLAYTSKVRINDGSQDIIEDEVRVNKPVSFKGVKLYQLGYGWAPVVRVIDNGAVVYDGPLILGMRGPNGSSTGVIKLPGAASGPAGLELSLFPDFKLVPFRATNPDDPRAREPGALDLISTGDLGERPLVVVTQYRGDLGLDRPQNVYELDKTNLAKIVQKFATFPANANEKLGSEAQLDSGLSVELVELRRFTVLSVKRDAYGIPVAAVSATVMMISLYPALYAYRRRLWFEIVDGEPEGAVLRFGGVAYQRKDSFEEEFGRIEEDLAEALSGAGSVAEKAAP